MAAGLALSVKRLAGFAEIGVNLGLLAFFLILTYTYLSSEEAAVMGWDLEGAPMALPDGIVEVRPNLDDGSAEVVWAWHFHDHIIRDRNPEAPNYGVVADHPERIDAHFPESYAPVGQIRQHLNSIDYHPELDQVVVSSFIYDEIRLRIQRSASLRCSKKIPCAAQDGGIAIATSRHAGGITPGAGKIAQNSRLL